VATTIGEADVLERIATPAPPEIPWQLGLGIVLVNEKPSLFALYHPGEGDSPTDDSPGHVAAWVIALPDGAAVLLPTGGLTGQPVSPVLTTLRSVRRRWARLMEAELVQVAGREALHLAG
jgi:hypothetical protein